MRAYIFAPLAAVATLVLLILAVAMLMGADAPTTLAAVWLLSVPVVAFGLPLAFGGELLLVAIARALGRDPREADHTSVFLAAGLFGSAIGSGLWLLSGRGVPWWLTLLPAVACVVGAATFVNLRKSPSRVVVPMDSFEE